MQSVPIITDIVSLNPAHIKVYAIQHYVGSNLQQAVFSLGILRIPPPIKLTATNLNIIICYTSGSHLFLVFLVRCRLDFSVTLSFCLLCSSFLNLYSWNSISWTSFNNLTVIISPFILNQCLIYGVSSWDPNSTIQQLCRLECPARMLTGSNWTDRDFNPVSIFSKSVISSWVYCPLFLRAWYM